VMIKVGRHSSINSWVGVENETKLIGKSLRLVKQIVKMS
jgi:hypothetical protein